MFSLLWFHFSGGDRKEGKRNVNDGWVELKISPCFCFFVAQQAGWMKKKIWVTRGLARFVMSRPVKITQHPRKEQVEVEPIIAIGSPKKGRCLKKRKNHRKALSQSHLG